MQVLYTSIEPILEVFYQDIFQPISESVGQLTELLVVGCHPPETLVDGFNASL